MSRDAPATYRAPALDKGLEILELLADEPGSLSQSQIAARLQRSVGEIFRVLNNLERRGYLRREPGTGGYTLTLRLFELAHRFPPTRRLLDIALPEMRRFAGVCSQSCHLVIEEGGGLLVIADVENPGPATYSIRVGARFPLARRASSYVLTAFQPPDRFAQLLEATLGPDASAAVRRDLERRLLAVRKRGYQEYDSETVRGIIDVSFPVLDHTGAAIAALTSSVVPARDSDPELPLIRRELGEAAARISHAIGFPGGASREALTRTAAL